MTTFRPQSVDSAGVSYADAAALPEDAAVQRAPAGCSSRPSVRGPFIFLGEKKLFIKAVTYGTFAPDANGDLFPPREDVRLDFASMREAHVNAIRTYTTPPSWVFEEARRAGLRILVGIYWETRNCAFDDPEYRAKSERAVREAVSLAKAYPDVVLAYIIGNEVPPLVVRFHGRRTIEQFLRRLYDVAKAEDPGGLVTYGNYPSTEFLQLGFLDFYTLNVYLLERKSFAAYLDRMMIEVKGKPLLLGEVGHDSFHDSEKRQAEIIEWTIPQAFQKGVCGISIFGWTDDWVVGGHPVEDWSFGIVDRARNPKPAYEVVRRRFGESPFSWREGAWPKVSVVVCNYNGESTLDECLTSLEALDYPDYEIIYVDDGSTDGSVSLAERHAGRVRLLLQANQGLSVARNAGAEAARGEIIAYIDSDAYADPDWLRFLVGAMESNGFSGAGGPNLTPPSDGLMAQFIGLCPGNPTHVLRDNLRADHVPGVNMAFRRETLLSLGGFDPVHTRAGDDVDICWRIEDAGCHLAFSPAAIVWHHRRPSIPRYLKQQLGYGEAENQLERKHPERFNLGGYIRWGGRVYLAPRRASMLFRPFIYHGRLGMALFQTLYQKEPSVLLDVPRLIQWYFIWAAVLALSPLSLWLLPVGLGLLGFSIFSAFVAGLTTELPVNLSRMGTLRKISVIGLLHFLHPIVRWWGRASARRSGHPRESVREPVRPGLVFSEMRHLGSKLKETRHYWGVSASQRENLLRSIQKELKRAQVPAAIAREWDNHDLQFNGTLLAEGRLYTAPEHFDQALCCGVKAYFSPFAKRVMAVTYALGSMMGLIDVMFLVLLVVPAVLFWRGLEARARLRATVWESLERFMSHHEGKRF